MKGKILDFSIQTNTGLISGEDSQRYTFSGSEWKEANPPVKGQEVDFAVDAQGLASGVYAALSQRTGGDSTLADIFSPPKGKSEQQYTPLDWYQKCIKNYINFNGRARRKEFWLFQLMYAGLLLLIGGLFGNQSMYVTVLMLALFLPSLTVSARRLHDTGRSGWWTLIALLPFVGILLLIFWWVQDSQPEANAYGAMPK